MSKSDKEIRNKWLNFKSKQGSKMSEEEMKAKTMEFHKLIKMMFGGENRR